MRASRNMPSRQLEEGLPLASHHSVHVQPGQWSRSASSPDLEGFEFVESLVEEAAEVCFVPSYFLQGLIVRQEALAAHPS
jgi:hypothetical protein